MNPNDKTTSERSASTATGSSASQPAKKTTTTRRAKSKVATSDAKKATNNAAKKTSKATRQAAKKTNKKTNEATKKAAKKTNEKTSKKTHTKGAKKTNVATRTAAKTSNRATPKGTKKTASKAAAPTSSKANDTPRLLSGDNPQIPKGDGDAPVQAYIAAIPDWKQGVARRVDELVTESVPNVRKAVKWNTPFYGLADRGWFLSCHCFKNYLKLTFFKGTSLRPMPPGTSKVDEVRYLDIRRDDDISDEALTDWIVQASKLPGWIP